MHADPRRAASIEKLERSCDGAQTGNQRDVEVVDQLFTLRRGIEEDEVFDALGERRVHDVRAAERRGIHDRAPDAFGARRNVARAAQGEPSLHACAGRCDLHHAVRVGGERHVGR